MVLRPDDDVQAYADWLADRYALTRRETQVLGLLIIGSKQAEIAEALGVAPRTVRAHVASIHDKTNTHNRDDLPRLVLQAILARGGSVVDPRERPANEHGWPGDEPA